MSLTHLLKDYPRLAEKLTALVPPGSTLVHLRSVFDSVECPMVDIESWFANPQNAPMLAPPRTRNYPTVGTAFDYFMRFELKKRNPAAYSTTLICERALDLMARDPEVRTQTRDLYRSVVSNGLDWIRREFPASADGTGTLAAVSLALAQVDPYYRTKSVNPTVGQYDKLDHADMMGLALLPPWDLLGGDRSKPAWLNPEFGLMTKVFNGADADLIAGDVLIDIKTTQFTDLVKHIPQLLGYTMIGERFREMTDDRSEPLNRADIHEAGIYFARHGILATFDVEAVKETNRYERVRDELFHTAAEAHVDGVAFI